MRKYHKIKTLLSATLCTAAIAPLSSQANPGNPGARTIEEVIVTAQRRAESLQETPIAINAFSSEDMATRGISDVADLAAQTPTIYGAPYPSSNTVLTLYMRGQGNNDPMQITKDGSIGIYENGVYIARPQKLIFELADVERVEVLRGPQGTLYGRNTTGGAMNIVSRAPSGEFGIRQTIGFGDRQQVRSVTHIDLPRWQNLSSKLTLAAGHDDGYVKNAGGNNNYNAHRHRGARLALLWEPSEHFSADYAFTWGDIRSTQGYLSNPFQQGVEIIPGIPYRATKYKTYRPIDLRESPTRISDHTLTLTWELGPDLTLRSLTGLRHLDTTMYTDYAEAFGFGFPVADAVESDQFSQELQLLGRIGDRIEFVSGLYYFDESAEHRQVGSFEFVPGTQEHYDRFVDADATSMAAYLQVTWTPPILEDRLELTLGARQTRDRRKARRDYVYNGFVLDARTPYSESFSRFTPSFTVGYQVNDNLSTYAKVATGYRSGGAAESAGSFTQGFDQETLITYEAGIKADWLQRRLRTNIAAFYSDYDDIQLDVSPDPDNISITQTFNAGKAVIQGVEIDVDAVIGENLNLYLSYAYLDTDVKKARVPGTTISAKDFTIPYAPRNAVSLGADYQLLRLAQGNLSAHLNYAWKDGVYNTSGAGPNVPGRKYYYTDAYGTLNGRLTFEYHRVEGKEPVRVSLWARNLLDKSKPVYTVGLGDSSAGYFASAYNYQEPFSFGVDISFEL